MTTAIAVLGGIGLFLLGMTVMTDGLKALAGSSLRTVLGKAAATPLSGAFWGAIGTLLVQSSSAVTMTTIGLVSAGLLTFPQGLGLVFGANVGTTGTAWLIALIGVRVSLSTYALPMIFLGAMTKVLASGRIAAAGAALAGFALVLYGLTTLQQGMGGLAATMHPSDLPSVLGAPGVGWLEGSIGLLKLVFVGFVMTAVMQSSTASIAVTISAFYAGAVGLEQGAALIVGQNIGTATSSALAAIGASATAKRLALAYVLFKVIAAIIALVAFPFTAALMGRLAGALDGTTLLAAYHTAYNVVGVGCCFRRRNGSHASSSGSCPRRNRRSSGRSTRPRSPIPWSLSRPRGAPRRRRWEPSRFRSPRRWRGTPDARTRASPPPPRPWRKCGTSYPNSRTRRTRRRNGAG